jgi:hypothetical protein
MTNFIAFIGQSNGVWGAVGLRLRPIFYRTAAVSKTSRRELLLLASCSDPVDSHVSAADLRHSRGPFSFCEFNVSSRPLP